MKCREYQNDHKLLNFKIMTVMTQVKTQADRIQEIQEHGIMIAESLGGENHYGCDLHNELYNTDYFIIGSFEAKQFLMDYGVFEAIEKVRDYENDNFGECYTDLSNPEKLVNMLAYVIGEEFLSESETLREEWEKTLTSEDLALIAAELRQKASL